MELDIHSTLKMCRRMACGFESHLEHYTLVAQISRGPLLESGKVSGRDRPRVLTPLWQNGNAPSS